MAFQHFAPKPGLTQ